MTGLQEWRYSLQKALDDMCALMKDMLHKSDLQRYGATDRMLGIAGLLSAICRSPEFNGEKDIIQILAERLVSLKNLEHDERLFYHAANT